MKKYLNSFWFNNTQSIKVSDQEEVTFYLKYNDLLVGTLSFFEGNWYFEYSEDFKAQSNILPLINFPDKSKKYISDTLWPFFATRVPSNAQLLLPDDRESDLINDLKQHGTRTIANPFILNPAF